MGSLEKVGFVEGKLLRRSYANTVENGTTAKAWILASIGDCGEKTVFRVNISLTEGLANAIHHGNVLVIDDERQTDDDDKEVPDPAKEFTVVFQRSNGCLHVEIENHFHERFNPKLVPDSTDPANLEKPSGRGLLIMRHFSDRRGYNMDTQEEYLGNRLVMEWDLDDGQRDDDYEAVVINTDPHVFQWNLDVQATQEEDTSSGGSDVTQNQASVRASLSSPLGTATDEQKQQ